MSEGPLKLGKSRSVELPLAEVNNIRFRISASESQTDFREKFNDEGVQWAGPSPVAMVRPRRKYHTISQHQNILFLYGGESKEGLLSELYQLDITNNSWLLIEKNILQPPPLSRHRSSIKHNNFYIIGGQLEDGTVNQTMYSFNIESLEWNILYEKSSLTGKVGHTCCDYGDGFILFGGRNNEGKLSNDIYFFNAVTNKWDTKVCRGPKPPPRRNHAACSFGKFLYVYGGQTEEGESGEFFVLDCSIWTWSQLNDLKGEIPPNGHGFSLTCCKGVLFLLGGKSEGKSLPTSSVWVLSDKHWKRVQLDPARSPKNLEGHRVVSVISDTDKCMLMVTSCSRSIFLLDTATTVANGEVATRDKKKGISTKAVLARVRKASSRRISFGFEEKDNSIVRMRSVSDVCEQGLSSALVSLPPEELRKRASLIAEKYKYQTASIQATINIKTDDFATLLTLTDVEHDQLLEMKKQRNEQREIAGAQYQLTMMAETKIKKMVQERCAAEDRIKSAIEDLNLLSTLTTEFIQDPDQQQIMQNILISIENTLNCSTGSESLKKQKLPALKKKTETPANVLLTLPSIALPDLLAKPKKLPSGAFTTRNISPDPVRKTTDSPLHKSAVTTRIRRNSDTDLSIPISIASVAKNTGLHTTVIYHHLELSKQIQSLNNRLEKRKTPQQGPRTRTKSLIGQHKLVHQCSANSVLEISSVRKRTESTAKRYDNIVNELIVTEKAYIADLLACSSLFEPLLERKIVNAAEFEVLFHNQPKILQLNKEILAELVREAQKSLDSHDFGTIFAKFVDRFLATYSPYCCNLVLSRRLRTKLCVEREAFHQFLEQAQHDPRANKQDLKSFLIKPLQRLCKYPLLLQELSKFVSVPETAKSLKNAIKVMGDVLNQVNDKMLAFDQQEPLLDIRDMFEDMPIEIVVPGRTLIEQALMVYWVPAKNRKHRTKRCTLVILSDCLMTIEESKNKGNFVSFLTAVIPFKFCALEGKESLPEEKQDQEFYFIVSHTNPHQSSEWGKTHFLFLCEDESEVEKWVNIIKEQMKQNQNKTSFTSTL